MKNIVFVGQTPPPYGGQSIMIAKILEGQYDGIKLFHVKMSFSKEMDEIGRVNFYKIIHLIQIILRIYVIRIFKNATVLYYPPAGPDRVPIIRDLIILGSTRWLFKKVIFHFHAGGLSEFVFKSRLPRFFYMLAYSDVDCAILLSEFNPHDGKNLNAKREVIIPYGIEDNFRGSATLRPNDTLVTILFVGVIKESKGVLILLEACEKLKLFRLKFQIEIMGKFESKEFENRVKNFIQDHQLEDYVLFLGVLSGDPKFRIFSDTDIFCFPTFFEAETFGVVLLEAMQFALPVVATTWRGIPSVVKNGESGFLVKPRNVDELVDKLKILILDSSLRQKMGEAGRNHFLDNFTLVKFQKNMEEIFKTP